MNLWGICSCAFIAIVPVALAVLEKLGVMDRL